MNIDELRRKLRLTEQDLAGARQSLVSCERHNKRLGEENTALKGKILQAVGHLLPEGTTLSDDWDNYKEPGY